MINSSLNFMQYVVTLLHPLPLQIWK